MAACAVVAGLGVASASTWMREEEGNDGRLVQILRDDALEPVDAHVGAGRR